MAERGEHGRIEALLAHLSEFAVIDLSHRLEERMPVWPTLARYYHNLWYAIHLGDDASSYQLVMSEHTGTHVDAPGHFLPTHHPRHAWVDQVSAEAWMGRAALVDCRDVPPRSRVAPAAIRAWEAEHGEIRAGDIVVFRFGWAERWAARPHDREFMRDWPGLGEGCASLLMERGVKAVGVDTLSPDVYGSPHSPIHRMLLGNGVLIVENLANLGALPPVSYLLALPLKIREGTGSPVRAVALVPHEDAAG